MTLDWLVGIILPGYTCYSWYKYKCNSYSSPTLVQYILNIYIFALDVTRAYPGPHTDSIHNSFHFISATAYYFKYILHFGINQSLLSQINRKYCFILGIKIYFKYLINLEILNISSVLWKKNYTFFNNSAEIL